MSKKRKYRPLTVGYPLIEVDWSDSHSNNETWSPMSYVRGAVKDTGPCKSIGWLLAETDDMITIASHLSVADFDKEIVQVAGLMTIPKVAIRSRHELEIK